MEKHDEGFARNVMRLFGPGGLYAGMGDSPLKSVTLSDDKETITFAFEDGSEARFGVEGDCCSQSWIEHLDVPPYVIGEKLVAVSDARTDDLTDDDTANPMQGSEEEYRYRTHECLQVYQTHFKTAKGDIVLEYRNSSNGYYGGYLVRR